MKTRQVILIISLIVIHSGIVKSQWIQTNGPYGGNIKCFAIKETNLFAGTWEGVYRSADDGAGWTKANEGLEYPVVRTFTVSGSSLFVGTTGGVYLSINNGGSWKEVTVGMKNYYVTSFAVSGTRIFAGTFDGVFLSTDNADNWTT